MAYPSTKTTFTDPNGTSLLTSPDHAGLHTSVNDTLEAIQDTVGTTAGTNVLKNFAAGDFPARINASNVLQQRVSGTVDNVIAGTPSMTAGTWSNPQLIGTPTITGGTITTAVINTPTVGTPTITGGTVASALVGTSQMTGGSATNVTVVNPTIVQDWDGWITASDTWVYASPSTFTISGVDRTAIFTKGTRLKFTQTTAKYAVVISSSFSTNTTVTIAVNTDYTIANASITSPFYSHMATPAGYPIYFNDTSSTVKGSTGTIGTYAETAKIYRYSIIGNMITVIFKTSVTNNGSWTGNLIIPIPVTAASTSELFFGNCINQAVSWGSTGAIINYGPAYVTGTNIQFKKQLDTNDVQITDMTAQYVVVANGVFTF